MGVGASRVFLVVAVLIRAAGVTFILGVLGVVAEAAGANKDIGVGAAGAKRDTEGRAVGVIVGAGTVDLGTNVGVVEATPSTIVDRGEGVIARRYLGARGGGGGGGGAKGVNRDGVLVAVGFTFAKRDKVWFPACA